MSRFLDKMDLKSLSALTFIPIKILKERIEKLKLEKVDGEYKVTQDLIIPINDDGLFTAKQIAEKVKVTDSTVRKRLIKAGIEPEILLLEFGTKLYRLTKQVMDAMDPKKGKNKSMPTKAERLENKGLSKDVMDIIEEERLKKTWVGKRGFLVNEQGNVVSKGRIEVVSSCGVFVNGVMGDIKMLRLGE